MHLWIEQVRSETGRKIAGYACSGLWGTGHRAVNRIGTQAGDLLGHFGCNLCKPRSHGG